MTWAKKLRSKLEHEQMTAFELRALLRKSGANLLRSKGSHEVWGLGEKRFVLATHSNELKHYQMKAAREFLYGTQ